MDGGEDLIEEILSIKRNLKFFAKFRQKLNTSVVTRTYEFMNLRIIFIKEKLSFVAIN